MSIVTLQTSHSPGYVRSVIKATRTNPSTKKKTQVQVEHFWYNSWPSHGVPMVGDSLAPQDLLRMRVAVNTAASKTLKKGMKAPPPILVHCGGGVSRTGTYIALDCVCDELTEFGEASLPAIITSLREDRAGLVQYGRHCELIAEAASQFAVMGGQSIGFADVCAEEDDEGIEAVSPATLAAEKATAVRHVDSAGTLVYRDVAHALTGELNVPMVDWESRVYEYCGSPAAGFMSLDQARAHGWPAALIAMLDPSGSGRITPHAVLRFARGEAVLP